MPKLITPPDDACIGERPGIKLYLLDFHEDAPLYRNIKIICDAPWYKGRKAANLSWIVHMNRCRGGGDCWLLEQHKPELRKWIELICATELNADYVIEMLGINREEYDAIVAAEQAKYAKK